MMIYLAYGSNINLKQMAQRCPAANTMGSTILNGYQLLFRGVKGAAVATIEKKANNKVPVLIWELKPSDQAALDRYEGYPKTYRKEYLTLLLNGKYLKAMVYVMNASMPLNMPSRHYYDTIKKGYLTAGFNISVLNEAVRVSSG